MTDQPQPRKMPAQRVLKAIVDQRWAMTEPALRQVIEIAARLTDGPQAVAAQLGKPLENTRTVRVRENGVAHIEVVGPIFRRANYFTEVSGATSLGMLARDLRMALDDPNVTAIVLEIDSPGGEVNGVNELSKMLYAARGKKPIIGYVGHLAASAGYWLLSTADEIVIDETATLGSIGVVATVPNPDLDPSGSIEIVSSNAPKKRLNPNTEDGREEIQRQVDALADVFVAAVARHRGVTEATVVDRFGQGGVLVGRAAIKAGLADRIGTLEQVIADLGKKTAKSGGTRRAMQPQEIAMSHDEPAAPDAVDEPTTTPEPTAPAAADGLADLKAILATDPTISSLEPLTAVRQLMTEAVDGRAFRADVVKEALAAGVRAIGPSFDEARYTATFARLDIESIQAMRADWDAMGDKQFPGGRLTVTGHTEPEQPSAPVAQAPASLYAA